MLGPPARWKPLVGWRVGGHLGCFVRVACLVVRVVFGCSLGLFPGLNP
jgi:hypothetical protein